MAKGFDYVIVGGGSAGCVLAARLSEDASAKVLLLEAGGGDRHPLIHMPVGFAKMTAGPFTWGYQTAPQRHANNRVLPFAQARVIGGGSSINAEVFTRGHASDYDRWALEEGCDGWSAAEVRQYFLRSEGNTAIGDDWHGTEGPLGVSDIPSPMPVTRAFVESCVEVGMPANPDFNGATQAGTGVYQTTTRNARRCSAAVGYLKPAQGRANLTVALGCAVQRVVFNGRRAVAVRYVQHGQMVEVRADSEVIVCSGAVGSPKLMMLSGVGPAENLAQHGIDVVQDLPGVGENLTDHFGVDIVAELQRAESLNKYRRPHWAAWAAAQYALFRKGPVTSNVVEGGAFWFSDPGVSVPDLQFHFLAGSGAEEGVPDVPSGSGITLNSYATRPKSRGTVRLRSADPGDAPIIDPNFLAEPEDLLTSVQGVRICREIFGQPALGRYIKRQFLPGEDVKTRADHEAYVRQYGRTSYHPVGTCKMGKDVMAVLDPQMRVCGLDGLRICDSSAMPSLIGSNTNAAVVMMAEKASDMIKGNR